MISLNLRQNRWKCILCCEIIDIILWNCVLHLWLPIMCMCNNSHDHESDYPWLFVWISFNCDVTTVSLLTTSLPINLWQYAPDKVKIGTQFSATIVNTKPYHELIPLLQSCKCVNGIMSAMNAESFNASLTTRLFFKHDFSPIHCLEAPS